MLHRNLISLKGIVVCIFTIPFLGNNCCDESAGIFLKKCNGSLICGHMAALQAPTEVAEL